MENFLLYIDRLVFREHHRNSEYIYRIYNHGRSQDFFRAEHFSKIFKKFLKKIAKNALVYHIFPKNLTNHALIFCGFGRKTQLIGNFEKIFENFQKFS